MNRPAGLALRPFGFNNVASDVTEVGVARAADLPGAAHLVLAEGVVHLDPAAAVFEAMLEGWARQQRTRFLKWDSTIKPRLSLVRRLATFSNQYPRGTRQIRCSTHSHLRYIRCNIVEDVFVGRKSRRQIRFHNSVDASGSPSHLRFHPLAARAECCIKRNSARFSLSRMPE